MEKTILWLVKFFDKEEYADEFLRGRLLMRRMSYFQKLEDVSGDGRADRHEGVATLLQPSGVHIEFRDHPELNIHPENLASPVLMRFEHHQSLYLFCTTAIHTGKFGWVDGQIEYVKGQEVEVKEQIRIHEDCLRFGPFAVITKAAEFILQAKKVIEAHGIYNSTLVEYYDPESFNGNIPWNEIPFHKPIWFANQSEYRIAVDRKIIDDSDSWPVSIGDIRQFSAKLQSSQINGLFQFSLEDV
ncbi:MAG: hypothetical protein P4M09_12930 [Devosia sp.]|nr:hypothetical protein [Devosia sp.]